MRSLCTVTLTALLAWWNCVCLIYAESSSEQAASAKRIARRSVTNLGGATDYLMYYHHMLDTDGDIAAALASFQLMANLTVTGELNDETMEMMNKPRCGVEDHMGTGNRLRKRRYDAVTRWPENEITWRISSFTNDLSQEDVKNTLNRAFGMWAEHADLTFTQVTNPNEKNVDFEIKFESGDHGDGPTRLVFDGRGKVLGHAFFPDGTTEPSLAGDIHFDKDEEFTLDQNSGTNLLQLAVHEIGHALGLGHSDNPDAAMGPFYGEYDRHFRLHLDDIEGIKYLYGRRGGQPGEVTMKPNPGVPNCPTGSFDAMVGTDDGRIFAFKGNYVWQIGDIETGILPGYPKRIDDTFPQLPSDIDAGLFHHGEFYFFKGSHFYKYTSKLSFIAKHAISHSWKGVPNDIDAVFHWSGNGKIYFIKGNKYYRFNTFWHHVDWGYPKSLSKWNLGFDVVDAVLQFGHSPTYFFTGIHFYRYNDKHSRPEEGYPRITSHWWFGCGFANLESNGVIAHSSISILAFSAICILTVLF